MSNGEFNRPISVDYAPQASRCEWCGKPAEEQLTAIGGCDLIAMAPHGRQGLQRLVQGSATEHVLDETMLPLLIVRSYATATQAQSKAASQVEATGIESENLAFTF